MLYYIALRSPRTRHQRCTRTPPWSLPRIPMRRAVPGSGQWKLSLQFIVCETCTKLRTWNDLQNIFNDYLPSSWHFDRNPPFSLQMRRVRVRGGEANGEGRCVPQGKLRGTNSLKISPKNFFIIRLCRSAFRATAACASSTLSPSRSVRGLLLPSPTTSTAAFASSKCSE